MNRRRWECQTRRRRFIRATEEEIQQKLESILEVLQIGSAAGGLANPARSLVQEVRRLDTERLPKRRKHV
jgi:hypothetical protein